MRAFPSSPGREMASFDGSPSLGGSGQDAVGPGEPLPGVQWPLKRYARFVAPGRGGGGPGSWEVIESCLEKGFITLLIVHSGHFLISQGGTTLLEGFSLMEAHKWWKAVRKRDCVLFGSKVKNESRMFRVQFSGDSHEQALENCSNCVQKLLLYLDVQNHEGRCVNQALLLSQSASHQIGSLEPEACSEDGQSVPQSIPSEGRMSIKQLAKSMLGGAVSNLPLAYQQSALTTEELGPYLKLCLLDQSFPAFVEQVEQELKKLIEE
ncbi:meiotic recombination protein REC114 [Narcine bancroftii]|uniref:meiotic recombination protein REC114 n=1 Tax=Narcine bancroftii TaxID=1343680 RepID=UPI0038312A22